MALVILLIIELELMTIPEGKLIGLVTYRSHIIDRISVISPWQKQSMSSSIPYSPARVKPGIPHIDDKCSAAELSSLGLQI